MTVTLTSRIELCSHHANPKDLLITNRLNNQPLASTGISFSTSTGCVMFHLARLHHPRGFFQTCFLKLQGGGHNG